MTKEEAEQLAEKYLSGNIVTKKEFYSLNHISTNQAVEMRKLLKEYNLELFERFSNVRKYPNPGIILKNKKEFEASKEELDKIVEGLLFGIDGRNFDLLDYYMVTKKNFQEIMRLFEQSDYGPVERAALIQFFAKNGSCLSYKYSGGTSPALINKKQELEGKTIIGGVEVSLETKLETFKFLEENNIPQYTILYGIKLRRILQEKAALQYCKKR